MTDYIKENIEWIESGKIGCVFASALVKQREKIGWQFEVGDLFAGPVRMNIKESTFIYSLIFPNCKASDVKWWAISNEFYIENIGDLYEGLRIKMNDGISWVQYFGPDSHVKTRQAPHAMLSFTVKLPAHIYAKTMAKGLLHLAHASIEHLTAKKAHTLWDQSIAKTKKELGFSPRLAEAAKTTFVK